MKTEHVVVGAVLALLLPSFRSFLMFLVQLPISIALFPVRLMETLLQSLLSLAVFSWNILLFTSYWGVVSMGAILLYAYMTKIFMHMFVAHYSMRYRPPSPSEIQAAFPGPCTAFPWLVSPLPDFLSPVLYSVQMQYAGRRLWRSALVQQTKRLSSNVLGGYSKYVQLPAALVYNAGLLAQAVKPDEDPEAEVMRREDFPHEPEHANSCVLCFDRHREIVYLPCRHFATCQRCTNSLLKGTKTCPVCRKGIQLTMKVYVA